MMQYKSQIPKYWWLELLLVTVSDAELGENINSVVFGVNKKKAMVMAKIRRSG